MPLRDNLEAYYKFNNNGLDFSGNGRDLTYTGVEAYTTGRLQEGYSLTGDEANFAEGPTDTALDFSGGGAAYTIQVWINLNNAGDEEILIEKFTGPSGPGWTLVKLTNNGLVFAVLGTTDAGTAASVISTGTWHQVVVRSDGSDVRIFLDGSDISSPVGGGAITASTNALLIGERDGAQAFPVDGALDEIALWSRGLSNAEITQLYNGGAGLEIPFPGGIAPMRFVKGVRSRHRSLIRKQRNYHTGLVGSPPNSIDTRRLDFVKGIRARHRSQIVQSRNYHTGLSFLPIVPPIRTVKGIRARHRSRIVQIRPIMIDFGRRATISRGLYRVFNTAGYRFYRTDGSPPVEGDSPLESNPTLPHTTVATWPDGDWYTSVDFQNGILSSGFLVLGANGETWLRLPITGGAAAGVPPQAPIDVRLVAEAGGVIRVFALYLEVGAERATNWAIAFTTDGSDPPEDTPTITPAIDAGTGLAVLEEALPAQLDGTLVRVRVQVRRAGTPIVYSEGSQILDLNADAVGPTAPLGAESWPGSLPESL